MLPRLATFWRRMMSIYCASVLVGVRQQGEEACTLDRNRELALIERLRARDAAGDDLARLRDVTLQRGQVFVVNVLDAFGREAAELLRAGKPTPAASPTPIPAPVTTAAADPAAVTTTTAAESAATISAAARAAGTISA